MIEVKKEFTRNGEIVATLYLGDCYELLAQGKLKTDALVSDPPYGINFIHGGGGGGFDDSWGLSILQAYCRRR